MSSTKRWLIALAGPILGLLIASLFIGPILGMTPRYLPVALVNEDAGATTAAGTVQSGETLAERLTSADQQVISWSTVSADEAAQGLQDGDYYAVLTIPADFTTQSIAAQASGDTSSVELTSDINQANSPIATQLLTSFFTSMADNSGVQITQNAVNPVPAAWGTKALFMPMMAFFLVFFGSIFSAFLIVKSFPIAGSSHKATALLNQTIAGVVGAAIVGIGGAWLISEISGIDGIPFANIGMLMAFTGVCYILLASGSINFLGIKGIIIPVLTLILGSSSMSLPGEFLPGFWRYGIYPWVPTRYFAQSLRHVVFANDSWMNHMTIGLVLFGVVALIIFGCSVLTRRKPTQTLEA